mgnify:CR=1 FL=1|jgi:hypothetical protein|tara:strand:- start:79 stop:222 length:144 start_codon:yes stop_codon:yes gene_type:complete
MTEENSNKSPKQEKPEKPAEVEAPPLELTMESDEPPIKKNINPERKK